MTTTGGTVVLERREQVAVVRLQRPDRRNALDRPMWDALEQVLASLHGDPARAVVLTGEGQAFCAGHDVTPENPLTAAMMGGAMSGDPAPVRQTLERLNGILQRLERLPMPTIAAINGPAHGGGVELALRCDFRVLDEGATLCMPETRLGLMPDLGGTTRLVRLAGRPVALDLILTGRDVRADEALSLGLVNRLAPAGHALDAALDLAALVAQNGPRAVREVKAAARAMEDLSAATDIEREAAVRCILSGEAGEGLQAWAQRRPAQFPDSTEDPG